jgi:hypothetical protein
LDSKALISVFDFENQKPHFPAVKRTTKFCLFTAHGKFPAITCDDPQFLFFGYDVTDLADPERKFTLSPSTIARINPNTRTCPVFRSQRDAALTGKIHDAHQVLVRAGVPDGNPWHVDFTTLFHMSGDSARFHFYDQVPGENRKLSSGWLITSAERWAPLCEQNLFNIYDHRFATFAHNTEIPSSTESVYVGEEGHRKAEISAIPRYWVSESELKMRWSQKGLLRSWSLAFRQSARTVDSRTGIFCVLPQVASGHSVHVAEVQHQDPRLSCARLAEWNSYTWDYLFRQSLGGNNTSFFVVKQVASISPEIMYRLSMWSKGSLLDWLLPRVLELSYTAWDLEPFARDCGWFGPPFAWDETRRFQLRCELDAAFFHLYGLSRDDTAYILDTFPIVRRKDESAHGTYRTKDTILALYDQLAEAEHTGHPFASPLNPPPASLGAAHRWSWRDLPMEMPEVPREPLPLAYQYVVTLMTEMVLQSGGSLPWKTLRTATDLLADRKKLARLAGPQFDKAADWLALKGDTFDATHRFDQLSGLCFAGRMRVVSQDAELVVELLSLEQHADFPHVRFDARLALAVAAELPAAVPEAASDQERRKVASLVPA